MRFVQYTEPTTLEQVFTVRWMRDDLERLRLDPIDQALIDECNREDATLADRLLGLQTIAFRLEQQQAVSA